MIKLILLIVCVLILASCVHKYKTNVKELIDSRKASNDKTVNVKGYVYIDALNSIHLHDSKNSLEYLDVAFPEGLIYDKKVKINKYICLDITGRFTEYNNDIITTGVLTSDYGLITAKEIKRCKE